MKDLSGYIESILCDLLPNSRVDVYLVDQRHIIRMDIYEVRRERSGDSFLKDIISEWIDSELKTYFPTEVPKHKKIVQVYEHEYR
jgi:hypothetical protein